MTKYCDYCNSPMDEEEYSEEIENERHGYQSSYITTGTTHNCNNPECPLIGILAEKKRMRDSTTCPRCEGVAVVIKRNDSNYHTWKCDGCDAIIELVIAGIGEGLYDDPIELLKFAVVDKLTADDYSIIFEQYAKVNK